MAGTRVQSRSLPPASASSGLPRAGHQPDARHAAAVWHLLCACPLAMEIIRNGDDKSWDRFVERHDDATVAHLSAWGRIIERAYGHESVPLAAIDGDEIVGVLPLVRMKSRLFGHGLVSMPFLDYGGIVAEPGREIERALLDAALGRARATGAESIGLRQYHPLDLGHPVSDDR